VRYGQVNCEPLEQRHTILGSNLPALLEFNDPSANFPIGGRQNRIDCAGRNTTSIL
jgi:hypothetical protein